MKMSSINTEASSLLCASMVSNLFDGVFRVDNDHDDDGTIEEQKRGMEMQQLKSNEMLNKRRKSNRPSKPPNHLNDSITDPHAVGQSIHRRLLKTTAEKTKIIPSSRNNVKHKPSNPRANNRFSDFKCDHCGSRYVVNPMRRGNKVSTTKYKVAPRHKIDPETQKILSLCNACGLKFSRQRKSKPPKLILSPDETKRIQEEDESFVKDLSDRLGNETALRLFCPSINKTPCRCVQKFICGEGDSSVEAIVERAFILLELAVKADDLKKLKCYSVDTSDKSSKIGLGNGHRKSQEFEDFVLSKRQVLRNDYKLCEKGTQKILSYSNNFLHKRMKTDPEKGYRIERQKGKAALGHLKDIEDLPLEPCCVDNCVRLALTHGKLLQGWRERAALSQVEARRVLAEMLTPSGGNRANCYRFITWVTGCSSTTIGKVNEQMKMTGGDREPPEHGLKKYWKENPKKKLESDSLPMSSNNEYVPSNEILKTAANSAGISKIMQEKTKPTAPKKRKRLAKSSTKASKKGENMVTSQANVMSAQEGLVGSQQNINTVIALYSNYQNGSFISLPAGLSSTNTISLPEGVSLQSVQQQLQQQQQLQMQIQILQHQLQQTQAALPQAVLPQNQENTADFMVSVSTPLEANNIVQNSPIVVQTVTTQPVIQNVASQTILPTVVHNSALPTLVAPTANANTSFVTTDQDLSIISNQDRSDDNTTVQQRTLLTAQLPNSDDIILTQAGEGRSNLMSQQDVDNSRRALDTTRLVHIVTSQSPTMAITQPVTIALQTPTIALPNLPTMLVTQQSTPDQTLFIHHQPSTSSQRERLLIQPSVTSNITSSTDTVIIERSPVPQSSMEQVSINNSILPSMTTFNTDVFFSSTSGSGNSSYSVFTNESP